MIRGHQMQTAGSASRLGRGLAGALLLVQAFLFLFVPVLDGHLDANSASAVVHVEDQGATKCPRVHHSVDCLICRTFTERGTPVPPTAPLVASSAPAISIPASLEHAPNGFLRSALQSRAPPVVSHAVRPIA